MRRFLNISFMLSGMFLCLISCNANNLSVTDGSITTNIMSTDTISSSIKIKIGSKTFTATLYDNPATKAFIAMLPLTVNMEELNGNEKHGDLNKSLPGNSTNPGTIQVGDLMIWNASNLVLFYKTFNTHYTYVKLGHITETEGLEEAVGADNITVTFE